MGVEGSYGDAREAAGRARHTRDIDLYLRSGGPSDAEQELRAVARIDLGDYFRFELGASQPIVEGISATRLPVVAYLGATEFARFHVDLVTDLEMTGIPDEVSPLVPIELPGVPSTTYRVYPVPDHIADKVSGMLEVHRRSAGLSVPSTRYRDLADLSAFAHTSELEATALVVALESEAKRRQVDMPKKLPAPTGPGWPAGYARVAREAPDFVERDLESAMTTVGRLIDPVLSGEATGSWNPHELRWA